MRIPYSKFYFQNLTALSKSRDAILAKSSGLVWGLWELVALELSFDQTKWEGSTILILQTILGAMVAASNMRLYILKSLC